METKEKCITKICSFYANKWHLTIMLLPYISKMIENGYEIETILEDNIEENMKELTERLNINNNIKKKILDINWASNKSEEIKSIKNDKQIVLIEGSIQKISQTNKYIEENNEKNISIINCYHVTQIEDNISEILSTHDLILNTSGNHEINKALNP